MPNRDTNASKSKKGFPKYSEGQRDTTNKEQRGSNKENPNKESRWNEDKSKKGTSGSSMKPARGVESEMDDMDSEQRSLYRNDEDMYQ